MRTAAAGGLAWVVLAGLGQAGVVPLGLIETLFLLAPLVLVPLALGLVVEAGGFAVVRVLLPVCAAGATASFLVPRGVAAAGLAGTWLALTAWLAWEGLARLRAGAWRDAGNGAIAAGLLLVPVGAGWLVLSRFGATPLGFEEPIILLTAVHFHYSAFVAPVLAGLMVRALGVTPRRTALACGVVAGPLVLAAGITLSPLVEVVGAALVAAAVGGVALETLANLRRLAERPLARALLAASSLAVLAPLALAVAYAGGRFLDHPVVSLATMARVHGTTNAMGFALCGLLGWTLNRPRHFAARIL